MPDINMVDRFEADGAWEMPQGHKGATFPGTLRLDQNIGPELKISKPINMPEDIRNILNPSSDRIVIRGQIQNSIDITLYDCVYFGSNSLGGINNITYRPGIVITGKQPNALDNLSISAIRFMSPALDAVFRSQSMMYRLSKSTFPSDYSRPRFYREIINLYTNTLIKIHMCSTVDGTIGEIASLNPADYIHISFVSEVNLDAAQSLTRSLCDFLSLLVGDWISPSRMRLRINGVWVDFWCHSVTPEHALSRWIYPNRVLQHSAIDFQAVLEQWTMLRSRMEIAFNVMRAAWSNNITLIDAKLLLSAQAIEGLHRRLYNGKYMDDTKFMELCDIVKADLRKLIKEHHIESRLAQKLNTIFDYANEFSLRQRIKELRSDLLHMPKSSILISNGKIEDIVSMRNALAHNLEHSFSSMDMYKNFVRIRWLFEASILNRLNIDGNVIQEILDARYERML